MRVELFVAVALVAACIFMLIVGFPILASLNAFGAGLWWAAWMNHRDKPL